jgi:hypothetical protein
MNLQENIHRIKEVMGLLKEEVTPECQQVAKNTLPVAVKYWKDWLNHPSTKEKFMINNRVDETKLNEIYEKYFNMLNNLEFTFYDNTFQFPNYNDSELLVKSAREMDEIYAFVTKRHPNTIFYNCSLSDADIKNTLIHEISHLIDYIHPKSTAKQINRVFSRNIKPNKMTGLRNFMIKLGITDENELNKIIDRYTKMVERKSNYDCDLMEKLANVQIMRSVLNKQPGENVTVLDLKPYITFQKEIPDDIGWFIACWADRGFSDLEKQLNDMNLLVKQGTQNSTFV